MAIIHISRPELTTEERARRMEAIKQAAVDLVIATAKKKEGSTSCKNLTKVTYSSCLF